MHQRGALAKLANAISAADANISFIHTERDDGRFSHIKLSVLVKNRAHLAKLIQRLRRLQIVHHIHRPK